MPKTAWTDNMSDSESGLMTLAAGSDVDMSGTKPGLHDPSAVTQVSIEHICTLTREHCSR